MRSTIEKIKERKGITLIALVVTIVVILILAGITVGMVTSDNGILKETKNAKQQAEIDNEKSIVERAKMLAMMRSKNGAITYEIFEPALKDEAGANPTDVSNAGDTIEVLFTDSNRYYEIDQDGNVSEPQEVVKDEYAGDITKGGRCDGSEEKPYEINCVEDLVALSNISNGAGIKLENGQAVTITTNESFDNKNIILTRSLNFKSKYSYKDSTRTDFGDINGDDTDGNSLMTEMTTGTGFEPIGQYNKEFKGKFDGKENSIFNIYINSSKESVALFGCISGNVQIKNLCIQGQVKSSNNIRTAGLVGGAAYGDITIKNCINKIDVYVENCSHISGFIAHCWSNTITITNCVNMGNITSNDKGNIGGFVGRSESNFYIYNSCNIGEIKSLNTGYVAGIAGDVWNKQFNIENFCNLGNIYLKSEGYYGKSGIISNIRDGSVILKNVYNIGLVDNNYNKNTGALCGHISNDENLRIENSYYWKETAGIAVYNKEDSVYGVKNVLNKISNQELVEFLNNNIKTENTNDWKKWKLGSDGYPTFAD